MDELIRDSVIAFVVVFVAIGGLITWYTVRVRRHERGRSLPAGIVNRVSLAGDQGPAARRRQAN